jgi:uroporphyrinogen-III synthase
MGDEKMRESTLALSGKKCLIMRQADESHPLVTGVKKLGGIPTVVPLIAFRKQELSNKEVEAIKTIHTFHWIVFTSQNGVHFFMKALQEMAIPFPRTLKVAAVGKKTKRKLDECNITVDFTPHKFTGDHLAEALRERVSQDERILIVKGNLARDAVGQALQSLGCDVDEVIIYETYFPEESHSRLVQVMEKENVDVLIFTSPSTVENFVHIAGQHLPRYIEGKVLASIGPVTKKAMRKYGMPIHVCPEIYTMDELLNELALYFK